MSVPGIEAVGFTPYVPPQVGTTDRLDGLAAGGGVSGPSGAPKVNGEFGDLLLDGIQRIESVNDRADSLAVQAATGDLDNIHDYTTAATEAKVTTQLTVAVRNKALEAFNEIMRMPIG